MNMNMKKRMGKGGADLKKYRDGKLKKLTYFRAIHAKCFDCMNNYQDGKIDCEIPNCSLYPYMPYKGKQLKEQSQEG